MQLSLIIVIKKLHYFLIHIKIITLYHHISVTNYCFLYILLLFFLHLDQDYYILLLHPSYLYIINTYPLSRAQIPKPVTTT